MPRAASIMQPDDKRCYITGFQSQLDCHHIYGGPNRNTSDNMGFWIWLEHGLHMKLHAHAHPCETLQHDLKVECQKRFEEMGHTREEFMRLIGRSYL